MSAHEPRLASETGRERAARENVKTVEAAVFVTENAPSRGEDPDERPRSRAVLHRDEAAAELPWLRRSHPDAQRPWVQMPQRVFVPVRSTPSGIEVLRLFKDALGTRVGVGFTSAAQLRAVLGSGQEWTVMAETCLRETLAGLGVDVVVRDPRLSAAPVAGSAVGVPEPEADAVPGPDADAVPEPDADADADDAADLPACMRHIPRNDRI
ncbi:SAV_915 family protein [Yinghuangia soli]|uniref:SseB protein N-terminal domain-containing protein n=1 Tax=Yinghuangia soli TaxID=2908204 RepID=A0AA41TZP3_9ACTN|nr:SAV_915 family protein [Yinghuangia soli]MCF2527716.1 hypothetical protein [Yinghuangia soli]